MKIGQHVAYIDQSGTRQTASVTKVPGTGKSGFKTLDLAFQGGTATDVVHGNDRVPGEPYWLLQHERDVESETPVPTKKKKAKAKAK